MQPQKCTVFTPLWEMSQSTKTKKHILASVSETHGRLDLFINNAGVFGNYDFGADIDAVQRIEAETGINAVAPMTLTKRALPL
ncbi:MAG: hypothetical protein AAF754_17785, partial [Pseudomonadota bacterium]